jgi:hypothetical protein
MPKPAVLLGGGGGEDGRGINGTAALAQERGGGKLSGAGGRGGPADAGAGRNEEVLRGRESRARGRSAAEEFGVEFAFDE